MDRIDNVLETVFSNKYSSVVLTMFLVFYSGLAAPSLPSFVRNLFENPIFRILILSLIVYKGNKDPQLAIMIAVGFTVTMNFVSSQKFFENFTETGTNNNNSTDEVSTMNGQGTGDQGTGDQGTGDQGTTDQGTTDQGTGDQGTGDQGTTDQGTGDQGDQTTSDQSTDDNNSGTGTTGTFDNIPGDDA